MTLTRPCLALVGVVSLVALTGCSGGGGNASSTAAADTAGSSSLAAHAPASEPRAAAGFKADASSASVDASTVVEQKAVIKNGTVVLHTADPQRARDRVDLLLTRLQGSIDDEQTVYDKRGLIRESRLALRVPVASFTVAMDDLESLGTVVHSSSTGQDVTTAGHRRAAAAADPADQPARPQLVPAQGHQHRPAAPLRERDLTQRRGQYQSLKAQRDHLVNQTSMSTIDVDLSVPPTKAAVTHPRHAGFVTGLRHGWSAFTGTVLVVLTVLGAVLPFAVVLALVGLPLGWWWLTYVAGPAHDPVPSRRRGTEPLAPRLLGANCDFWGIVSTQK